MANLNYITMEDRKSFKTTAQKMNLSDCRVICSEVI